MPRWWVRFLWHLICRFGNMCLVHWRGDARRSVVAFYLSASEKRGGAAAFKSPYVVRLGDALWRGADSGQATPLCSPQSFAMHSAECRCLERTDLLKVRSASHSSRSYRCSERPLSAPRGGSDWELAAVRPNGCFDSVAASATPRRRQSALRPFHVVRPDVLRFQPVLLSTTFHGIMQPCVDLHSELTRGGCG